MTFFPRRTAAFPLLLLLVIVALVGAGCEKAEPDPTPTPDRESMDASATLFAQPTRAVGGTATVTPPPDVELELNRVIARMAQAALDGDIDAYLSYISDEDPLFYAEQTQWAQDWVVNPLRLFDLELFGIRLRGDDEAVARLTLQWSQGPRTESGASGGATVSVVFTRHGDGWQLVSEDWTVAEVEGFRLYFFDHAMTENRSQAEMMLDYLPGIHTVITRELGFEPDQPAAIKLYEKPATLQTLTRISMPLLTRWNEPGEAIKITLNENNLPPPESTVAGEYARYLLYEMAGGTHGGYTWWLQEAVAEYGESRFRPRSQRNRTLRTVGALALAPQNAEVRLLDWDAMVTEPDWREEQLLLAADQGATLLEYITATYGADARNAWIRAIGAGQDVDAATEAELDITFDQLDADWRAWLVEQIA